jgi:hypothetical protein
MVSCFHGFKISILSRLPITRKNDHEMTVLIYFQFSDIIFTIMWLVVLANGSRPKFAVLARIIVKNCFSTSISCQIPIFNYCCWIELLNQSSWFVSSLLFLDPRISGSPNIQLPFDPLIETNLESVRDQSAAVYNSLARLSASPPFMLEIVWFLQPISAATQLCVALRYSFLKCLRVYDFRVVFWELQVKMVSTKCK